MQSTRIQHIKAQKRASKAMDIACTLAVIGVFILIGIGGHIAKDLGL